MSEFRVEKGRLEATLTLSDGRSVRGYVFVSSAAALHGGPERIKDLLNADTGFFPFELVADGTPRTVLYHRDHVVFLTLGPDTEAEHDAGYEVAVRRSVTVLLSSGHTTRGRPRD